jgi:succinate dehydrogenase / fumarate reductase cytochrome b subunit
MAVKFLNVFRIRYPITAIVSIGHRISGILLFLSIPLLIYFLDRSLESSSGYTEVVNILASGFFRMFLVFLTGIFVLHLLAGIRFLLIDLDLGLDSSTANKTSWIVIILTAIVIIIGGWCVI